jgi:hypothetical protein
MPTTNVKELMPLLADTGLSAATFVTVHGEPKFRVETRDGVQMYVNPALILAILQGAKYISGILADSAANNNSEMLQRITERLEEIKTLLIRVIDLIESIGDVIDEHVKALLLEFIRTKLLGQISVFETKLPSMEHDRGYAKHEAAALLRSFEQDAAQVRNYGPAPFETAILAMVHQRALCRFADEPKKNQHVLFRQYQSYFKTTSDTLEVLLAGQQKLQSACKANFDALPKEIMYAHCQWDSEDSYGDFDLYLVFKGSLDDGAEHRVVGNRENRNAHEHRRGGGAGGGHRPFSSKAVIFSDDQGWEQRLQEQVALRNSLRDRYLNAAENVLMLDVLKKTAAEAEQAAGAYLKEV